MFPLMYSGYDASPSWYEVPTRTDHSRPRIDVIRVVQDGGECKLIKDVSMQFSFVANYDVRKPYLKMCEVGNRIFAFPMSMDDGRKD